MKSGKIHVLFYRCAGYFVGALYWILAFSWRYRLHFHDDVEPVDFTIRDPGESLVFAHWHGDELALIGFGMRGRFLTFASKSKDGTIMASALKLMGFSVIRGSSSRGGASALVSMIRAMRKQNYFVSFAVDGPRGPRHKAKPGAYMIASKMNCPMIQCLVDCRQKWEIPNTWNKTYIPRPFARIDLHFYSLPQAIADNQEDILSLLNSRTDLHLAETIK